jgi:HEPN domain-containing protein
LKAFLISNNIDFERTHDLEYLVDLCLNLDSDFEWLYEVSKKLSEYAVEIRYPDEFYIPSLEEARQCFGIVSKVKDFMFKKFNIEEKDLKL